MTTSHNPLVSLSLTDNRLHLRWQDGRTGDFSAVWLQDNAPEDRDPGSGQRLTDVADLPDAPEIASAESTGEGTVRIAWKGEERVSCFPTDWMYSCAGQEEEQNELPLRLWTAAEGGEIPVYDYAAVRQNPVACREWLETLATYGLAFLTGVPAEEGRVLEIASRIGYVRETNYGRLFDVRAVAAPNNLAYTTLGLGLHTDNPYRDPVPGLQLLHCLRASGQGGESLFADGFALARHLRQQHPQAFERLARTPVRFAFRDADNEITCLRPFIELDHRDEVRAICYNNRSLAPFRLPADTHDAFYEAYRLWASLMRDTRFQRAVKLRSGDLVAFDNTRLLHGRTAFTLPETAGLARHLQGCYLDKDGLFSRLAVLSRGAQAS